MSFAVNEVKVSWGKYLLNGVSSTTEMLIIVSRLSFSTIRYKCRHFKFFNSEYLTALFAANSGSFSKTIKASENMPAKCDGSHFLIMFKRVLSAYSSVTTRKR